MSGPDAAAELARLGDALLDTVLRASPLSATALGLSGYDALAPDPSDEAATRTSAALRDLADRADALHGLSAADLVTRDVLVTTARDEADRGDLREVQFQTAPFFASAHALVLAVVPRVVVTEDVAAQDYLDRLAALPASLDETCRQLRAGAAAGRLPVGRSLTGSLQALDGYLAGEREPLSAPDRDDDAWRAERDRLVRDGVRPALARMRDLYRDELLPVARDDTRTGVCWLPDGEQAYAVLARCSTTTQLSPTDLHELGLHELDRLDDELATLGQQVFGTSHPAAVLARMRTELRLRDADDLLERSRAALARATAALPQWFGLLPPSDCALQPVPDQEAPHAAPAYYTPPGGPGRPGTYWVNTHQVQQRPAYDVETVAFHEAVPGHHLQLSIAQGLTELPLFRRALFSGAYAEGWGLYAERLADEMGLYGSDVDRLGMLSCDAWRACRLVVDTGLHAFGWSHQQAVDFLARRTALPDSVVGPEVDRYVGLPGQALSYLVGRLEIVRLRREAERQLGARFDVRDFHDQVLRQGSLPLTVLDRQLTAWTSTQAAAPG